MRILTVLSGWSGITCLIAKAFCHPMTKSGSADLSTRIDTWTKSGIWPGNRRIRVKKAKVEIKSNKVMMDESGFKAMKNYFWIRLMTLRDFCKMRSAWLRHSHSRLVMTKAFWPIFAILNHALYSMAFFVSASCLLISVWTKKSLCVMQNIA